MVNGAARRAAAPSTVPPGRLLAFSAPPGAGGAPARREAEPVPVPPSPPLPPPVPGRLQAQVSGREAVREPIRILLVEDQPGDADLVQIALEDAADSRGFLFRMTWADSLAAATGSLKTGRFDAVLLDLGLSDSFGLDTLDAVTALVPELPVVVLTGQEGDDIADSVLRHGGADYLAKSEVRSAALVRAIRYAIERKKAECALTRLAMTDPLTGLMSRAAFFDRLDAVLSNARRTDSLCAIMHLDLDSFKEINDTHGHPVGDTTLCEVASRLQSCLRASDLIARLGGDEFAIVATNVRDINGVSEVAQKLLRATESIHVVEGRALTIRASIGITMFPYDKTGAQDLLVHADVALYQAKRQGKGGYCFFDAEMNRKAQAQRALRNEIAEALAQHRFVPYFQPIMDTLGDCVRGAEVLARWRTRSRGLVPPSEFIPFAEEIGAINDIGALILDAACAQQAAWREKGLAAIPIAINVSGAQFRSGALVGVVRDVISRSGVPPSSLQIEITESMLMQDVDAVCAQLRELRGLGIRVALDDFGTGYSSLSLLGQLPIDEIKIDRSFTAAIESDARARAIIGAIVTLARGLTLEIIAEGVETYGQAHFLRSLGVYLMQGYYFSKPLDAGAFMGWYQGQHLGGGLPSSTAGRA